MGVPIPTVCLSPHDHAFELTDGALEVDPVQLEGQGAMGTPPHPGARGDESPVFTEYFNGRARSVQRFKVGVLEEAALYAFVGVLPIPVLVGLDLVTVCAEIALALIKFFTVGQGHRGSSPER